MERENTGEYQRESKGMKSDQLLICYINASSTVIIYDTESLAKLKA